jgi:hypothetical protein
VGYFWVHVIVYPLLLFGDVFSALLFGLFYGSFYIILVVVHWVLCDVFVLVCLYNVIDDVVFLFVYYNVCFPFAFIIS